MFSIRSYYQILDLEASNNNLLVLYDQLLESSKNEDLKFIKLAVFQKIKIRKEIKKQLSDCLDDNFVSKRARIISKISSQILPLLVEAKYRTLRIFNSPNWELVLDYEVQNIRIYYNILFDQRHSRSVTNLLLHQKSKVETCIIEAGN